MNCMYFSCVLYGLEDPHSSKFSVNSSVQTSHRSFRTQVAPFIDSGVNVILEQFLPGVCCLAGPFIKQKVDQIAEYAKCHIRFIIMGSMAGPEVGKFVSIEEFVSRNFETIQIQG